MDKGFKILLVSIIWDCSNKVLKITKGHRELKPSNSNGIHYEYDLVLYTKVDDQYFQFSIETELTPYLIERENNEVIIKDQLFKITDNLWIFKGDWDTNYLGIGYHKCPTINTVGRFEIGLSTDGKNIDVFIEIDVNPNIEDFDFNVLKDDFEGELWSLLTYNKSKLSTKVIEIKLGDKIFRFPESQLIISFLKEFDIISKNPKRELKYSIEQLPVEKVKPISKTYQQIAKSGLVKNLPSKAHKEHFDIYENRFLCFMLFKIFQIVKNNIKFTNKQINKLQNEIKSKELKIAELENPPILNSKIILNEIAQTESYFKKWKEDWNKNKIDILNQYDNENCFVSFCIVIKYKSNNYDYWVTKDGIYCLMRFPIDMSSIFEEEKNLKVTINAKILQNGNAGNHPKYKVKAIKEIDFIYINTIGVILKQKETYAQLFTQNWKQILTLNERKEKENQITTIRKQITSIDKHVNNLKELSSEFIELASFIAHKLNSRFFNNINYKSLATFKPSMTFVQNQNYRKAYNYYQKILQSEGIDIKLFGLFEQITNYSIREMPQVYEIWTLISVIKILEESYCFKHNSKDFKKLLEVISPDSKKLDEHVKIRFDGNINGRTVVLHYQKKLKNNKRPDILLEITVNSNTIYLILDAKFKNYNYKLSATYEARNMLNKYGIDSHYYVFILHPCKDLDKEKFVTKLTNFGGEKVYVENNQIDFPFHQYGYLMLKPLNTDNLKKIIGMAFEYLIENKHNAKNDIIIDPKPENEMICISCGKGNVIENKLSRGDKDNRYYYAYECQNSECGHKIYIDYCWNCKTKLYKHGSYWDYHKTSIWSIFDIHCPNCGMTVADRPNNDVF